MPLFKCKMCGGDLEINDGISIAECEYCGTKQTVPKAIDENLQTLFNRANTLRIKSEFDKAEKIYEKIIQADSKQAEAYWGLILCKYGIEYVDDPATFKKVPTCHRASFDSIVADDDYKSAIEYADMSQRALYEAQAKEIDRIQKDILALAQKEENYDVFLCYKETDANGQRTQDSVIANDIYYQLTGEGFKVFYAAITLEGKLGSAYEPIIFAALNSAKVMLVIGTKPEYFNAVWVKNEWSRYLKIIKKDRSKLLIPCYRDMDAYELPEEFAHLQAQDMSKIGFINDVVRGIKKIVKANEPNPTVVKETVVESAPISGNVAPLLKRAFMFLEDGDFASADEYCEKVLDQDPENAHAYLGKLMAELEVRKQGDLQDVDNPFDDNSNYKKVLRYGGEQLKTEVMGYIEHINTRNANALLEEIYNNALKVMLPSANTEEAYKLTAQQFARISGYKNSDALAKQCLELAETIRKDTILSEAKSMMTRAFSISSYTAAMKHLESISGWKDADERIVYCQAQIEKLKAIAEEKRLESERQAEIARQEAEIRAKKIRKIAIIVTPIVLVLIAFYFLLVELIIPNTKYNNAIELREAGNYEEAIAKFTELYNKYEYKDSQEQINVTKYQQGLELLEKEQYREAYTILGGLGNYSDAREQIQHSKYERGIDLIKSGEVITGCNLLTELGDYLDAMEIANKSKLDLALAYIDSNEYGKGYSLLTPLSKYINSTTSAQASIYSRATAYYNDANYDRAIELFDLIPKYKDSKEKQTLYEKELAQQLIDEKDFEGFIAHSTRYNLHDVSIPSTEYDEYYDAVLSYYHLTNKRTYVVRTVAADIEPAIKYLELIPSHKDAQNVMKFYEIFKKYDSSKGEHYFFQNNMAGICKLFDTEFCKNILLSDNLIAYYLLGEWYEVGNYCYLKFTESSDSSGATSCSFNIPYRDVDYKYWDIQDLEFVFLDANSEVVATVYKLTFVDANTLKVFSYKDSKTYTITREVDGWTADNNNTSTSSFVDVVNQFYVYTYVDTKIRASAMMKASGVIDVAPRTALKVIAYNEDWYKVTSGSYTGYVPQDFVTASRNDTIFTDLAEEDYLAIQIKGDANNMNQLNIREYPIVSDYFTLTIKTLTYVETSNGELLKIGQNASGTWWKVSYDNNIYYLRINSATKPLLIVDGQPLA